MTEPRTTVYRGTTRSEVERAYHVGARTAVDEGYVPAGEEWSTALGQEVLTVRYVFDPQQGDAVLGALDAAERESRLAAMAPPVVTPPPAAALVSAPVQASKPKSNTRLVVLTVLVIGLGAYAASQSGILTREFSPIGGGSTANLPPSGQIWFGRSFDPTTLAVQSRLTSVGANEAFVAVGRLPRDIDASELQVRALLDGQLIASQVINATGVSSVWGVNLGPLFLPGAWRYEFADIGGNVLATGSLTVTE